MGRLALRHQIYPISQSPGRRRSSPIHAGRHHPDWASDAACKDLEPEQADRIFFPKRGQSANEGRALCRTCPVAQECLELALSQGEAFGIWGGTSERERRVLRREREATQKRRHHKPHKSCSYCGARAVAHGLCQLHYGRERRQKASA